MGKKMISSEKKDKFHTLKKVFVNIITGARSLGSAIIVPIFKSHGSIIAGLAAACFFATDFIDGQLARRLKVQSFFGSLLDTISDKAFGIVCLVLLALNNPIFWVVIAEELAIAYVNYNSAQKGNNIQSSWAGKVKTGILAATIVGSFFAIDAPTMREVLKFTNSQALDKVLSIDPEILTTIMGSASAISSGYVLGDYIKRSHEQTEQARKQKEVETKNTEPTIEEIEQKIQNIQQERQNLNEQKENIKVLKSGREIIHDLFDTEFYLEHKDDGIKQLLYKKK